MISDQFAYYSHGTDLGDVEISLIRVRVGETEYWEVASRDSRPLDLRAHKWVQLITYADEGHARKVYDHAVAQTLAGVRLVGAA